MSELYHSPVIEGIDGQSRHQEIAQAKGLVVMVPETFAFFGPFDSATKFFTLYEGMPVEVLKSKDDWYKVKRQDGKSGWIKKDKIQFIRN